MWKFLLFVSLKPAKLFSFLLVSVTIILEVTLLFLHSRLSGDIPLWSSKPWGIERLANHLFLWLIPTSTLGILLLNNTLANLSSRFEPVLARIISFLTVTVALLGFISVYQILVVVSP